MRLIMSRRFHNWGDRAMRRVFHNLMIAGMALALGGCAGGQSAADLEALASAEPEGLVLGAISLNGEICDARSKIVLEGVEKPNLPRSSNARYHALHAISVMSYSSGRISKVELGRAQPNMYLLDRAECSFSALWSPPKQKFSFNSGRKVFKAKRFRISSGKVVSLGVIEIKTPNPTFHKGRVDTFTWTSRPFNQRELADIVKLRPDLAGRIEHYPESRIK